MPDSRFIIYLRPRAINNSNHQAIIGNTSQRKKLLCGSGVKTRRGSPGLFGTEERIVFDTVVAGFVVAAPSKRAVSTELANSGLIFELSGS